MSLRQMTTLKLNHLISTPIFPTISKVVKIFEFCLDHTVLWHATPSFLVSSTIGAQCIIKYLHIMAEICVCGEVNVMLNFCQ